jgi:polysaccharide biosynthesis/export protein
MYPHFLYQPVCMPCVCKWAATLALAVATIGCGSLPKSGPSSSDIQSQASSLPAGLQLVEVTPQVARQLAGQKLSFGFSTAFGPTAIAGAARDVLVGTGDAIEVSIWEAPPATLFGASEGVARGAGALGPARSTTLPEQIVGTTGYIGIPFAGSIAVTGRTTNQIETEIVQKLKGKANQPQVLVRLLRNNSSLATVVGEVVNNTRVPLTARGEKLLDAIAAAGGSKQPVHKTTIQFTRGTTTAAMSLDSIIREPQHNIVLQAGDILTAVFQPLSFTALGASGRNDEINFEAQGITLAQALGRIGGLQDARADAQGVFIFRLESPTALTWPQQPAATTPEGKIPVIYRINLKEPASFFVAQSFAIENKDLIYISNAPAAEIQKFANLIYTIASPVLSTIQLTK